MRYEFKPENLKFEGSDPWMQAAIKLHEAVGGNPFTTYDMMRLFGISGDKSMSLLSFLVQHHLVRWLG